MHSKRFGESAVKFSLYGWAGAMAVTLFGQVWNIVHGLPKFVDELGMLTVVGGAVGLIVTHNLRRAAENVTSTIKGTATNGDGGGTTPPCPPPEQ
jgi:hypothetical protein